MPPQLVALSEGPNILLDKPILLIGRHQECDIQIPSRKISRRHCCIAQVNDHLVVRDLCSTNGIRINGVRVLEGNLQGGDELTIANYRYQVKLAGQEQEPGSPADAVHPAEAKPGPAPIADDPFVSMDQPVALKEPGNLAAFGLIPKAPAAVPPPGNHYGKPADKSPHILPEKIDLANSSGDFQAPVPKQ